MHAYVVDNSIVAAPVAVPRTGVRRLSDGAWIMPEGGLRNGTVAEQESAGYYVITEVAPPALTATQRADLSYAMVGGRPTQVWTVRNETPVEATDRARFANRATLVNLARAQTLITANETYLDWYNSAPIQTIINGTGNLSAAELATAIRRLAPQVERVTKGVNGILRYLIGDALLDDITDT